MDDMNRKASPVSLRLVAFPKAKERSKAAMQAVEEARQRAQAAKTAAAPRRTASNQLSWPF